MNKKLLIILGLTILVALGFYILKGKPSDKGFDLSDRDFKVENPEEVYSFSLERKNYPAMVFNRKEGDWILNNGRKSKVESVNHILNALKHLKIKYIPGQGESNNLRKSIDKNGIMVKLFDKNAKLIKFFHIGPDVKGGSGTAFLMNGATQPYVMYAINFQGSIRTRFEFNSNEYESIKIFEENPSNIKSIEIKYPYDKASSFLLEKGLTGTKITNPYTNTLLPQVNEKLVEPYLEGFKSIGAEYNDGNNSNREMILQQPIFCDVKITRNDGSIRTANVYSLNNIEFKENRYSPKEVSPDTRFMVHTNSNEFFLVQQRVLGKALVAFDRFAQR